MAQSINLIPRQEVKVQRKAFVIKASSIFAVMLLLVMSGISFYFWNNARVLENKLEELDNTVLNHRKDIDQLADIEISARELDARYQILAEILGSRRNYSVLITELNKRVPTGVRYESFRMGGSDKNIIDLSCTAPDYVSIARFTDFLSDSDFDAAAEDQKDLFDAVLLKSVSLDTVTYETTFTLETRFNEELIYDK